MEYTVEEARNRPVILATFAAVAHGGAGISTDWAAMIMHRSVVAYCFADSAFPLLRLVWRDSLLIRSILIPP